MLGIGAHGRIAKIVIAIVAKGHINNSFVFEFFDIGDVTPDSVSVFHAEHHRFFADVLGLEQLLWRLRQRYSVASEHPVFNFGDERESTLGRGIQFVGSASALRQIGSHNHGIESAFGHLVQVHAGMRIAMVELHVAIKQHGRVAMRIEGENFAMHGARRPIALGFGHQPSEQWTHGRVAALNEALGMPLHAQHTLQCFAFHRLGHSVGCPCRDAQLGAGFAHSLMMEGIDKELFAKQGSHQRTGFGLNTV